MWPLDHVMRNPSGTERSSLSPLSVYSQIYSKTAWVERAVDRLEIHAHVIFQPDLERRVGCVSC